MKAAAAGWTLKELPASRTWQIESPLGVIAEVVGPHDSPHFSPGQRRAHANLLAAAPDLLAACKVALARFHGNAIVAQKSTVGDGHALDLLRAAIAKAEGGAA